MASYQLNLIPLFKGLKWSEIDQKTWCGGKFVFFWKKTKLGGGAAQGRFGKRLYFSASFFVHFSLLEI